MSSPRTTVRRPIHIGLSLSHTWLRGHTWRRADSRVEEIFTSDSYVDLAQKAERARLDFVFKPDAVTIDPRGVATWPGFSSLDPMIMIATLARETSRIGLIPTISTTFTPPFTIARQLMSLDQISHGRAGWNAVMSLGGHEQYGLVEMPSSEDRYAMSYEYLDVLQQLWASYPADALIVDREGGRYADPAKIHPIDHVGQHYRVAGPNTLPAYQPGRLPMLQAGASPAGREFAARTADAVFAASPTIEAGIELRDDLRRRAVANGRRADDIRVLPGISFFLAASHDEAQRQYRESLGDWDEARVRATITRLYGVDTAELPLDQPIPAVLLPETLPAPMGPSHAAILRRLVTEERLTIAELGTRPEVTSPGHWTVIGTVSDAVAEISERIDAGSADGLILLPGGSWGSLDLFLDEVIPALVDAGMFRADYTGTTLRDHLGMDADS